MGGIAITILNHHAIVLNGAYTGAGTGVALGAVGSVTMHCLERDNPNLVIPILDGAISGALIGAHGGLMRAGEQSIEHLLLD